MSLLLGFLALESSFRILGALRFSAICGVLHIKGVPRGP
jgi:hypothetical protein